jgi:hypothetical protein
MICPLLGQAIAAAAIAGQPAEDSEMQDLGRNIFVIVCWFHLAGSIARRVAYNRAIL